MTITRNVPASQTQEAEEILAELKASLDAIEEIQCDPDLSDFREGNDLPPLSDRWMQILHRCTGQDRP